LSDNVKATIEPSPIAADAQPPDGVLPPTPLEDAEAQMRRALGLTGTLRPRVEPERSEAVLTLRASDRFSTAHRRRFVQDGDIPVSYVNRPNPADAARQAPQATALTARIERAEASLAAETTARLQAERTLQEAQTALRDLRTKLGHVDLARTEAVEALRREREGQLALRVAEQEQGSRRQDLEDRLKAAQRELQGAQTELQEERAKRKALEKSLRAAEEARETAERLVRVLSEEDAEGDKVTPFKQRRPAKGAAPARKTEEPEAEPVKWWLNPQATRRR
jgi:hypothetical protein